MTDSTRVVLPAAEAFSSGILRMREEAARGFTGDELAWGDYPVNAILVTAFVLLALLSFRSLMNIFPKLLDSLTRWKACVNIDASLQTKTDRNMLGAVYTIPIALLTDRYDLIRAGVFDLVPESWHGLFITAVFLVWLFIRKLCFILFTARSTKMETMRTAYFSFYNFWILAGFLMVITLALSYITGMEDSLITKLFMWEGAVLYAVAFVRKSQILRSCCGRFASFLYLCGLEILPTGAFVAGAILL